MSDLDALIWPTTRLGEALQALAERGGLAPRAVEVAAPPGGNEPLGRWFEAAAACAGLEAEAVESSYADVDGLLRHGGPALVRVTTGFLALVRGRRRRLVVLGPDLALHALGAEVVRAALCRPLEAEPALELDRLLDEVGIVGRRRSRARAAILREQLRAARIGGCWLLRLPPGGSIWRELRQARLLDRLLGLGAVHVAEYALWLVSWWIVGLGALSGRLDRGWLLAWVLLLLTLVPLRLLSTWWGGLLAIGAGGLFKRRLLYGTLRLEPEEIRHQGVGQLLGRVLESDAVESLALGGGWAGLVAAIELAMAAAVLSVGAGGRAHVLFLAAWLAFALVFGWRYLRRRVAWTQARLEMTHDLVERMVGHRTRQAQEGRRQRHDAEDQALARYLECAAAMDASTALLLAVVPRGWLLLGLIGLGPGFVSGSASPTALAAGLGGTILAYRALRRLTQGLAQLAGAAIAWGQVAPLFRAAARAELSGTPALAVATDGQRFGDGRPVLEAHDLVFRYRERSEAVLRGVTLSISAGERLLLEGPSGGGKSTLVSLLIGLREPESGILLLGGLDERSLGSVGWRRRVVAAPQFHENHVLTGTLAFNLLMARAWPPRAEELEEAEALCRELGLGELIARMPGGLLQMVGETGWQLSHGERSRLYIARALLQSAEVVILDESFAALDPENLRRALGCVLERTRTLLVVAHP